MATNAQFAEIAALSGDPVRACMLHALMDGRALTATELAKAGGVTPQTASGHLRQLAQAGLITASKQGRHRYHRIATQSVARMMESIMQVAAEMEPTRPRLRTGPADVALRRARTCYDHIAGSLGVALADGMIARGHLEMTSEAAMLTERGVDFLGGIGMDLEPILARRLQRSGRVLCRPCLDWSERRPHLAGVLGAALCDHSIDKGWVRRRDGSRALLVTPSGERFYRENLGVKLD
jgi:DNA-binding transcriptional ArsR family regulator